MRGISTMDSRRAIEALTPDGTFAPLEWKVPNGKFLPNSILSVFWPEMSLYIPPVFGEFWKTKFLLCLKSAHVPPTHKTWTHRTASRNSSLEILTNAPFPSIPSLVVFTNSWKKEENLPHQFWNFFTEQFFSWRSDQIMRGKISRDSVCDIPTHWTQISPLWTGHPRQRCYFTHALKSLWFLTDLHLLFCSDSENVQKGSECTDRYCRYKRFCCHCCKSLLFSFLLKKKKEQLLSVIQPWNLYKRKKTLFHLHRSTIYVWTLVSSTAVSFWSV